MADPRELDICIEGISRDRSSPLSKEEEYGLLKTTNVLVIFFTTRSRIWPDQNLSSSKSAQRDFSSEDGENCKQTEIYYYDLMIMRIFFHQESDSPMCRVNWFWLSLFMMITPYLSWSKTPTRKHEISSLPFYGKVTNENSWTSRSQNRRHLSLWRLLHFPKKKHEPLKTSLVQREKQHRR